MTLPVAAKKMPVATKKKPPALPNNRDGNRSEDSQKRKRRRCGRSVEQAGKGAGYKCRGRSARDKCEILNENGTRKSRGL